MVALIIAESLTYYGTLGSTMIGSLEAITIDYARHFLYSICNMGNKTFILAYDLNNHEKYDDYKKLYAYFKKYDYFKPLESTYFIKTSSLVTAEFLYDEIVSKLKLIDSDDRIFIADETHSDHQWRMSKAFRERFNKG